MIKTNQILPEGNSILGEKKVIINIGLGVFEDSLADQGIEVKTVNWNPPAKKRSDIKSIFDFSLNGWMSEVKEKIDQGNQLALTTLVNCQPIWIGCDAAIKVVPGMTPRTILHSGPNIEWSRMCQPMKNGILGAILFEELAKDISQAEALVQSGEITLAACHDYSAVGGMTGVTSANTPVAIVRDAENGNTAFCGLHEGMQPWGFSWGNHDEESISNLKWIKDEISPVLNAGLKLSGGLKMSPLISKSIQMGDEIHGRCVASTSLISRELSPFISKLEFSKNILMRVLEFLRVTDMFSLHIVMAAAKSMTDSIKNIPYSTIVTVMARNGVDFGIKVSGLGERWFVGPAQKINTVFFSPNWNDSLAVPDIGDSSVVEVVGLGGLIHAASPAQGYALGFNYLDSLRKTEEAYAFCAGEHKTWRIPGLDFRGVPLGIDILKVIATGKTPILDTATAHKQGGKIGIGEARAPMEAFDEAMKAFAEMVEINSNAQKNYSSDKKNLKADL